MSTTTLSATAPGRGSKVRFSVNETFELRKEALDDQRRKERKKAKVFESIIGRCCPQVVHCETPLVFDSLGCCVIY